MIKFSSRMNLLKGSAIRELLALANKPELPSLSQAACPHRSFSR